MANDSLVNVVFRMHTMPNETASKTAGRPIFIDMEVCDITFAANSKTRATFPAHDPEPNATRESTNRGGDVVTYAMLYGDQYRAFKLGETQPANGTPLSEAPFLTEGKRRELKALQVHTVEALASLDGTPLKMLGMGGREIKNQAEVYLAAASGSADVTRLAAENDALRAQLAEERGFREEFTTQAAKNASQRKVERDFAKVQGLEAKAQAEADVTMRKRMDDAEKQWVKESEKAERGQIAASPDFGKWSEAQLKDFIADRTGARPKGNPSHETLVTAAKELSGSA